MPTSQQQTGGVRAYADFLRANIHIVLAVALLTAVACTALASSQKKKYEASVNVLFRHTTIAEQVTGVPVFESPQNVSSAGSEMTTSVTLLGQESVAQAVRSRLRLPFSVTTLQGKVAVSQVGLSNVAAVKVKDTSPARAARIADTWADSFVAIRQAADRAKLGQGIALLNQRLAAEKAVDRRSAAVRELASQRDKLQLLRAVQDGNAEVTQRATVPTHAVSPKPLRTAVITAILGFFLGLAVAALRRVLTRRVKSPEDASELIGLPTAGELSTRVFSPRRLIRENDRIALEEMRTLATNLRYLDLGQDPRSIVVTSARPEEGKTTITTNLGVALAHGGNTVGIIDADLRRPKIEATFGIPVAGGLTAVAAGEEDFDKAWEPIDLGQARGTLHVLACGPLPPNPLELLASRQMREILERATRQFDYVLLDTPPLLAVSDAVPLIEEADVTLLAVRLGRVKRNDLTQVRGVLDRVGARNVALVLGGLSRSMLGYRAYDYYGGRPERARRRRAKAEV